jgi:hypothetical protein
VVDLSGGHNLTASTVLGTERVLGKEALARLLPFVPVPTLGAALALLIYTLCCGGFGKIGVAIAIARVTRQGLAAQSSAWLLRS